MAYKVFLSPSNQDDNPYAVGDTTEARECGHIADFCGIALDRSGVDVMIRHMDSMAAKSAAANAWRADLYVCIHTNATVEHKYTGGTNVFYYSTESRGYAAAKSILAELGPITPGKADATSARPGLYEMKTPNAPVAYVEVEFHDTDQGAAWILSHEREAGEAIARGICKYLGVEYKAEHAAPEAGKVYTVQLGAFKNRSGAEILRDELRAAGYDGAFIKEVIL